MNKPGDRYLKVVEWSEEDGVYVGRCPGLFFGGVHGADEIAVYKELCEVVEEWMDIAKKDGGPLPPETAGKEYSGRFILRVDAELHRLLAISALKANESLNAHCEKILRQAITGDSVGPIATLPKKAERPARLPKKAERPARAGRSRGP
jgi:predicted HicB family RNase H-like nuclease